MLILGVEPNILDTSAVNTVDQDDDEPAEDIIMSCDLLRNAEILTTQDQQNIANSSEQNDNDEEQVLDIVEHETNHCPEQNEGLTLISGWVAYTNKKLFPELSAQQEDFGTEMNPDMPSDWLMKLSGDKEFSLTHPSPVMQSVAQYTEEMLQNFCKSGQIKKPLFVKSMCELLNKKFPEFPAKPLKTLVRLRMFIWIRERNRKDRENRQEKLLNLQRIRKMKKTVS
jgi:hypothetical protein